MTINLDDAIKVHAEWKTNLRAAIHKREAVDEATIAKDNCCVLGKWLHNEAKLQYAGMESYSTLVIKHAAFHDEAGKIAGMINAKQFAEAELLLGAPSPYCEATLAVVQAITELRKEIGL